MRALAYTAAALMLVASTLGIAKIAGKKPLEISLRVTKGANPLGDNYATVEIKNDGEVPIEIWSQLPLGVTQCLDIEVVDASGQRCSQAFYSSFIASPFADRSLRATIPAGKSVVVPLRLFHGVADGDLKPGKYTCRVHFEHGELKGSSEPIEVEVTKEHIEKQ